MHLRRLKDMTNAEINKRRRWNKFIELNANPLFCTSALIQWAENGTSEEYPEPRQITSRQVSYAYKRTNCGRCYKCEQIDAQMTESEINDPEYWKRKAFDLAKAYGTSLAHLDELKNQVENLNQRISDAYEEGSENQKFQEKTILIHRAEIDELRKQNKNLLDVIRISNPDF
jgi:hypothetical protein